MRSRLDVTGLKTTTAPMAQCIASALYRSQAGHKSLIPMKGTAARSMGLRFITASALTHEGDIVGKTTSFGLGAEPLFMELSMSKTGGGYAPTRRNLYLTCGVDEREGIIDMRVGGGSVVLLRGPMRILTTAEAVERFGSLYKPTLAFNPERDGAALGVGLRGVSMASAMTAVRTIDADTGTETTVVIRKRERRVEL